MGLLTLYGTVALWAVIAMADGQATDEERRAAERLTGQLFGPDYQARGLESYDTWVLYVQRTDGDTRGPLRFADALDLPERDEALRLGEEIAALGGITDEETAAMARLKSPTAKPEFRDPFSFDPWGAR